MFGKALSAGVKIACGSDAPAIPHGSQADELIAMVDGGMTPMWAPQAATVTSADLIERSHDLGRLAPGYLADVVAVPGDLLTRGCRPHSWLPTACARMSRDSGRPSMTRFTRRVTRQPSGVRRKSHWFADTRQTSCPSSEHK